MTEKIQKLLDYQQADIDLVRMQKEIVKSPNRVKLLSSRDFLLKQKENIEKIYAEVNQMTDRVEAIQLAISDLEKQLEDLQNEFDANRPESIEESKTQMESIRKLIKDIVELEKELKLISKKTNYSGKQEYDLRIRTARVKQEFMDLKDVYDKEYSEQKKKLAELNAIAEEKKKLVDKALLAKYEDIKQHVFPPIAKLQHNQCSGCDMALPSVTLTQFNSGEDFLECSNCGRLIVKVD